MVYKREFPILRYNNHWSREADTLVLHTPYIHAINGKTPAYIIFNCHIEATTCDLSCTWVNYIWTCTIDHYLASRFMRHQHVCGTNMCVIQLAKKHVHMTSRSFRGHREMFFHVLRYQMVKREFSIFLHGIHGNWHFSIVDLNAHTLNLPKLSILLKLHGINSCRWAFCYRIFRLPDCGL